MSFMGLRTDKFNAVGDLIVLEIGVHIPVFHPFGYNGRLERIGHLDPLDRQDVVVYDLFSDEHLLAESLKVT